MQEIRIVSAVGETVMQHDDVIIQYVWLSIHGRHRTLSYTLSCMLRECYVYGNSDNNPEHITGGMTFL